MTNSRFTRFRNKLFAQKKLTIAGIATGALITVFVCVTAFYYFTTPSDAIVVTTADFPAGLSTHFTVDDFNDQVVSHLKKITDLTDSKVGAEPTLPTGLGPRIVKQPFFPIRALTNTPSPVFSLKWKGVDLNLCRSIGTSLKAKRFLELGVHGIPTGGWRLTAALKKRPHFSPQSAGSAPLAGGACSDFEKCADDLTEQVLGALDYKRLLNFYIKLKTPDANRRILTLYEAIPATSLQADDLVAWGNAFYGLKQFNQALQKFGEALEKDPNSCSAHVGRAFVYYSRADGIQKLADLQRAEQDFLKGISCDPGNEFTRTSLCHTLLQEWVNSPNRHAQMLVEARQHCEKALEINPQFVRAAVNLGYVLYRQGEREAALRQFDSLSQRYPTSSALFLNYGYLLYLEYLINKDVDVLGQAIAETLKAWKLDEKSDIAADNLGFFYYEQGRYAQAVGYWEKAHALNANDPDCLAGLALGAFKGGDQTKALAFLCQASQIDSHYCDPTYLKREVSWSDLAAEDLTELINLLPRCPCSGG